jgi:hypothetical protein
MKNYWKLILNMALPLIEAAGQAKIDEDQNETGKDDIIGQAILFGVKLFRAIVSDKPLPKAPEFLK